MEQKGYTKVNISRVSYIWEIKDFSVCVEKFGHYIDSPKFTDSNKTTEWNLRLYPKGCSREDTDLHICLNFFKKQEKILDTSYSISILDSSENKVLISQGCNNFNESPIITRYCPKKDLIEKNLLFNDKLIIVCSIKSGLATINELSACDSISTNENPEKLLEGLQIFLKNAKFSDVTITVKEKKFLVHKIILSATSPVFQAMFEHDMEEKNSNLIKIEDAEPDAIAEMLHYMYTGKVENLEKFAYELLILSDRYALEGLKTMCSETLAKNLTIDNALSILNLSEVHKSCKLKALTIEFVAKNVKEITDLPDFKFLLPKNSDLCAEIIQSLSNLYC